MSGSVFSDSTCGERKMLQVKKRTKRQRGKGTWILIFLTVAAVAGLLAAAGAVMLLAMKRRAEVR